MVLLVSPHKRIQELNILLHAGQARFAALSRGLRYISWAHLYFEQIMNINILMTNAIGCHAKSY